MRNWSKLQKELYAVIDPRIDFQIHCVAYRMDSQRGKTNIPRYFITVEKNILFDYPKQFAQDGALHDYPYITSVSAISDLIRAYIDTPTDALFSKTFVADKWQLTEILKAADRRIGQRRLHDLLTQTNCEAAKKIILKRISA